VCISRSTLLLQVFIAAREGLCVMAHLVFVAVGGGERFKKFCDCSRYMPYML
jgi:hypothetical protein